MKVNKINYKFNGCNITVIIRDDVDLSVFNEIFKYREYKSCEDIIIKAKNPIIDLGAHVGFFSIYSNDVGYSCARDDMDAKFADSYDPP